MTTKSLTAANAVITLVVPDLFNVPVTMQGFSADNVFDAETINSAETQMGVDGHFSAGFVYVPIKWSLTLQADSDSNNFFDDWHSAGQQQADVFWADGEVFLKALNATWTMTHGALTGFATMPNAAKILQPRKFEVTWQSILRSPV